MAKFNVQICRTEYAFNTYEVEATNEKEAEEKAMNLAYNDSFDGCDADYSCEDVTKID